MWIKEKILKIFKQTKSDSCKIDEFILVEAEEGKSKVIPELILELIEGKEYLPEDLLVKQLREIINDEFGVMVVNGQRFFETIICIMCQIFQK